MLTGMTEDDWAEAGLRDKALEAEHLRAQLARLRRIQFSQSSERLRDQIAQLGDLQPDHHGEAERPRSRGVSPCHADPHRDHPVNRVADLLPWAMVP